MLFEGLDLHIKANTYGVGSPQVNNQVASNENGPIMGATIDGKSQHWLVTRPFSDDTSFHELGHSVSREISLLFLFILMNINLHSLLLNRDCSPNGKEKRRQQ